MPGSPNPQLGNSSSKITFVGGGDFAEESTALLPEMDVLQEQPGAEGQGPAPSFPCCLAQARLPQLSRQGWGTALRPPPWQGPASSLDTAPGVSHSQAAF